MDCGRSGKEDPRRADIPEFIQGNVYPCEEEGFLTNEFGEKRRISERSLKLFFKQYRRPKEPMMESMLFPGDDEITEWGFTSHMEDFVKQLLKDPATAKVSPFLEKHGIDNPKAVEILLKKSDPNDENSAILIRKERIEDGGYDENGKRLKDKFHVKYTAPRDGFSKKLKRAYIELFENYQCDNPMLNEEGDAMGSTTTFGSNGFNGSGQFIQPLFGKPLHRDIYSPNKPKKKKKKKIQITEEQYEALKEMATTDAGNYQYDVPFGGDDETTDHSDMMKKSFSGYKWNVNEEGIHIKEKNKGKFTATKKKTGKSTEELTHSKNPLTRKRAIFAQNAKKWNHKK